MTSGPTFARGTSTAGPIRRLWQRLEARLRPEPIATVDALRCFLEERASLIAQKCAIDYCRGKTGLASYALFTEKPFLDALDLCRWETFAAVLGDLLILAEGQLRPHATDGERPRLVEALSRVYSAVLAELPVPGHRGHGWDDAVRSLATRLAEASRGEPRQALDVADHSARRLFDTLPIHSSMREVDEEVVYGAVRFRMIAVSQELQRRLRAEALVGRLLADQNVTL
jgi:hypothetical protein